ncbi:MAG TPA: hypothetical protein VFJ30_13775, partial [Phycisphaerae bacterium]|nr:hypothetical protein [Phycisphaerae bacterium]
ARGGRTVGRWQANRLAQCEMTPDGLLVMMIDGELTVRELSQIDKPLWKKQYDGTQYPAILGVSTDMVAVSPAQNSPRVEVLTIPGDGRKLASLDLAPSAGAPNTPFDARFDGQDLLVLCAPGMAGQRKMVFGRLSSSRGLGIQKFSVAHEKRLWACDFDGSAMYYPNVLPTVVGKNHVVVTARHFQIGLAYYAYVVDLRTGKVAQKIDLRGGVAAAKDENRRRQLIGQPVMTNGRLCVETSEGVTVYGEK